MICILHYIEKEQAINLHHNYFYSYDTCTYISQKAERNDQKICDRNNFITMMPILHYKQKEEAINLRQNYFYRYVTYTLLIFHENQKGTSNKFEPEMFSLLQYLYFTSISSKRNRIKQ